MILHIDMDAFFASIEQAINPRLAGKPLIVGSRNSRMHTVVCAASYQAKALGIDSGMPSSAAFRICPGLEFVPAAQEKYIWTSEQILGIVKEYGFATAYVSIDEFQMSLPQDTDSLSLAQEIQEKIYANFHISASVGLAKNCLLAKLASKLNKPAGITLLNENNLAAILAKTPAKKLCGVGESTAIQLSALGIETCLELYEKPPWFLEKALGRCGLNLYLALHSNDILTGAENPQNPKSLGHSYTFSRATQNPGFIKGWIRLLAEMIARRLRQDNLLSQSIHLWLNGPEIGNFSRQMAFQQASSDGYEIYLRAVKILLKKSPKIPKIRALGVTCSKLIPANYQPLFKEQEKREGLLKALDRINERFGEETIFPAITQAARKMPAGSRGRIFP